CDHFLTKPFDAGAVLDVVRRQVEKEAVEELGGLTKVQAEAVLDWLETCAGACAEVSLDPSGAFLLRWPSPPAGAPSASLARALPGQVRCSRRVPPPPPRA